MSDVEQTETGADVNALRLNIPVGESRDYKVAAVHQNARGIVVVAAYVDDSDIDMDECILRNPEEVPVRGETWRFTNEIETLYVEKII